MNAPRCNNPFVLDGDYPRYLENMTPDDSRWISKLELRDGLASTRIKDCTLDASGIPMDSDVSDHVFFDTSDYHNLVIGETGSGKSRKVMMEAVLSLRGTYESAVVFDPKAEICRNTIAEMKKSGFNCVVFDLRDPFHSACWNPFEWIFDLYGGSMRSKDKAVALLNSLSSCICPITPREDPYWGQSARGIISGLGLMSLRLAGCSGDVSFQDIFVRCCEYFATDESVATLSAQYNGDEMEYILMGTAINNCEVTRRCIMSYVMRFLLPYVQSEGIKSMLSHSDMDYFEKVMEGKMIIYIVAPDETDTLNGIVSLFMTLLYQYLLDIAHTLGGRLHNRVNYIIDEFGTLPRIECMPSMMSAARSRGIRFTLAIQGLSQLNAVYGYDANSIKGNCSNWIFMGSRDIDTLEEISRLAGCDRKGRRIVGTSELQRLDRDSGEALVLRNRLGPYMAHLRDIDDFQPVFTEDLHADDHPIPTDDDPPAEEPHNSKFDEIIGVYYGDDTGTIIETEPPDEEPEDPELESVRMDPDQENTLFKDMLGKISEWGESKDIFAIKDELTERFREKDPGFELKATDLPPLQLLCDCIGFQGDLKALWNALEGAVMLGDCPENVCHILNIDPAHAEDLVFRETTAFLQERFEFILD